MATYIIEGTIKEISLSEISQNEKGYTCKISGTEGFSLKKQEKKDTIKMNVLCDCTKKQNRYVEDNKTPSHSIKFPEDYDISLPSDYITLCALALSSGKRVRIVFEKTDAHPQNTSSDKTKIFKDWYQIVSLSLLSD